MSYEELKKLWKCNDKIAALNMERLQYMNLAGQLMPAILSCVSRYLPEDGRFITWVFGEEKDGKNRNSECLFFRKMLFTVCVM